jgi:hypothetical protein
VLDEKSEKILEELNHHVFFVKLELCISKKNYQISLNFYSIREQIFQIIENQFYYQLYNIEMDRNYHRKITHN